MSKSFRATLLCVLSLCGVCAFGATKEQLKKDQRPKIPVIQKDGKKAARKCFKDADKNGFCDNGSEQKWKCPNNCRIDKSASSPKEKKNSSLDGIDTEEKKQSAEKYTPCDCCPNVGNCAGACLSLLRTETPLPPEV